MAVRREMQARRRRPSSHALWILLWLAPSLAVESVVARGAEAQAAPAPPPAQPAPSAAPMPTPEPAQHDAALPPAAPVPPPPASGTSYPTTAPVYPPTSYTPAASPPSGSARGPYTLPDPSASYGYPALRGRLPGPGAHKHEGFFLRLNVGFGAGGARYRERVDGTQVSNVKTRGLEGAFELSIGGAVIENLIVHGSVMFVSMSSHKTVDGVEDSSYDELSTSMYLVGGGVTYYLMPTNIYLTLMLGLGGMVERRAYDPRNDEWDVEIDSDAGFATAFGIGKEWWVGRRGEWAIGAALLGGIFVAPMQIDGLSSTLRGHSVSMTFSTTFN